MKFIFESVRRTVLFLAVGGFLSNSSLLYAQATHASGSEETVGREEKHPTVPGVLKHCLDDALLRKVRSDKGLLECFYDYYRSTNAYENLVQVPLGSALAYLATRLNFQNAMDLALLEGVLTGLLPKLKPIERLALAPALLDLWLNHDERSREALRPILERYFSEFNGQLASDFSLPPLHSIRHKLLELAQTLLAKKRDPQAIVWILRLMASEKSQLPSDWHVPVIEPWPMDDAIFAELYPFFPKEFQENLEKRVGKGMPTHLLQKIVPHMTRAGISGTGLIRPLEERLRADRANLGDLVLLTALKPGHELVKESKLGKVPFLNSEAPSLKDFEEYQKYLAGLSVANPAVFNEKLKELAKDFEKIPREEEKAAWALQRAALLSAVIAPLGEKARLLTPLLWERFLTEEPNSKSRLAMTLLHVGETELTEEQKKKLKNYLLADLETPQRLEKFKRLAPELYESVGRQLGTQSSSSPPHSPKQKAPDDARLLTTVLDDLTGTSASYEALFRKLSEELKEIPLDELERMAEKGKPTWYGGLLDLLSRGFHHKTVEGTFKAIRTARKSEPYSMGTVRKMWGVIAAFEANSRYSSEDVWAMERELIEPIQNLSRKSFNTLAQEDPKFIAELTMSDLDREKFFSLTDDNLVRVTEAMFDSSVRAHDFSARLAFRSRDQLDPRLVDLVERRLDGDLASASKALELAAGLALNIRPKALRDPIIKKVVNKLDHKDTRIRELAFRTLPEIGGPIEAAPRYLKALTEDPSPRVRLGVQRGLETLVHSNGELAYPYLISYLSGPNPDSFAVRLLEEARYAQRKEYPPEVIQVLKKFKTSPNPDLRNAAYSALEGVTIDGETIESR